MTLPGFTAETSLYRTSGHYHTASAYDQINGLIYPAHLDRSKRITRTRPLKILCFPWTFCEPDPLNQFCYKCTSIDETCKMSTYQYCKGVEIPNKIPINLPDPVVGLTRRLR